MSTSRMPKVPAAGKGTSIRIDQELHDDLAVLMSTGQNFTEAVRHAVSLVAWGYRNAWDMGVTEAGRAPRITAFEMLPPAQDETSRAA